jgi:hypothetical protein
MMNNTEDFPKFSNNIAQCVSYINTIIKFKIFNNSSDICYYVSNKKFFKYFRALSILYPEECNLRYQYLKSSLKNYIARCFPKIIKKFNQINQVDNSYLSYHQTNEIQEKLNNFSDNDVYLNEMYPESIEKLNEDVYDYDGELYEADYNDYYKCIDSHDSIKKIISEIKNHQVALNIIRRKSYLFHMLPKIFMSSYEIGFIAIKNDIHAYKFTNDKLRNEKDLALEVLKQDISLYKYIGDNLKNDKELALHVFNQDTSLYQYVGDDLKNDQELALYVLKRDTFLYEHIDIKLKYNFDFILSLIKKIPDLFQKIITKFRNNYEIAIIAINYNIKNFQYVGYLLKDNVEFALYIVKIKKEIKLLEFFTDKIRNNEEIILLAVKIQDIAFKFAGDKLKNNKEFILSIVSQWMISHISPNLYNDSDFLVNVILKARLNIDYIFKYKRLGAGTTIIKDNIFTEIYNKLIITSWMYILNINWAVNYDEIESIVNYI